MCQGLVPCERQPIRRGSEAPVASRVEGMGIFIHHHPSTPKATGASDPLLMAGNPLKSNLRFQKPEEWVADGFCGPSLEGPMKARDSGEL